MIHPNQFRIKPTLAGIFQPAMEYPFVVSNPYSDYTKPLLNNYGNRYIGYMTYNSLGNWHHCFVKEIVPIIIEPVKNATRKLITIVRASFHIKNKRSYAKNTAFQ